MTIKALYPTSEPSLNLDFANTKRLDPRITFSRASAGTYFDENGTLRSAATNAARFDHNPTTGESLGLLVEEARTNTLTYSQQITNQFYSTGYSGGITFSNSIIAPDGTITASKLAIVNSGTTAFWSIYNLRDVPVVSGTNYTYSCFFKAGEVSTVTISTDVRDAGGLNASAAFTLTGAGSFSLTAGVSAGILSVGNGWYRCWVVGTADATTTEEPAIVLTYSGNGFNGLYTWGWQFEAGSFPTSYIPTPATFTGRTSTATFYNASGVVQTAASGVARSDAYFPDSNGVMRSAGLLLEAAATNLMTYSQQLDQWTPSLTSVATNSTAAPDGATTADTLTADGTFNAHMIFGTDSTTGPKTFSIFAKAGTNNFIQLLFAADSAPFANFNLSTGTIGSIGTSCVASIQKLANGWYRCCLSTTSTIAITPVVAIVSSASAVRTEANTLSTSVYLWGGQSETSPFPTSYIPTVASTVTRSADTSTSATVTRSSDLAQITGANFANFFVPNRGTFFVNWSVNGEEGSTDSQTPVSLSTPTNDAFVGFLSYDERINVGFLRPSLAQISIFADLTGRRLKGATAFEDALTDNTSASSAINGTLYNANTTSNYVFNGNIVANGGFDRLGIGRQIRSITEYQVITGCISRIAYWPTRLSDANLQALTV